MSIIPVKIINNSIHVLNDFVLDGRPQTYLNASISANAQATLSVFSIKGFSAGNYYAFIGKPGTGNAEIIKMHASTSPSGTTITLASNVLNSHDANEPVWFIKYNQWEFSNSATATGSKSTTELGLKDIDPTKLWTICPDDTNSSGYGFVRPYNVASTTYGSYSAAAPYASASFNTVEYVINEAVEDLGLKIEGKLTYDKCINWGNEGLRDIRKQKKKLTWAQSINTVLGQTARGVYRYSMPSDIYDKYSHRAIDRIRLGGEIDLEYVDPKYFFNVLLRDVHVTQVTTAASTGDTTLEIDNSYDFESSGTVNVGGNDITYTGVTRSATAGVLTGVPASGTGAIPAAGVSVDDWVWQNEAEGKPSYFTIYNGYIYIYNLPNSSNTNLNIYIDYYTTITEIDSLDDAIDYIQFDMIKNWLMWCIDSFVRNNGIRSPEHSNFVLYRSQLANHIGKDGRVNKFYFRNTYEDGSKEYNEINPLQYRKGNLP